MTPWTHPLSTFHAALPPHDGRPLVGITCNYENEKATLAQTYYDSVLREGGIPVLLPPFRPGQDADTASLVSMLEPLDALILSGGGDLNPLLVGEEPSPHLGGINPRRDLQELLLVRLAADRQIPILGICRGLQLLTAALGGTIVQDLASEHAALSVKHSQDAPRTLPTHSVDITPDTLLHHIYGTDRLLVNSLHHQAVRQPAPGMRVSALSADGVIEACEACDHRPILGVQWHPECLWQADGCRIPTDGCCQPHDGDAPQECASCADDAAQGPRQERRDVFCWLLDEARLFRRAKHIHSTVLTLDSHCDTPMFFSQGVDFTRRDARLCTDLHKMQEGRQDATIMVAYLAQGTRDEAHFERMKRKVEQTFATIRETVARCPEQLAIARTPQELYANKAAGRKSIMLGIENGYAIGRDITLVEHFRRSEGIVYMTLCHNGCNDICDSARGAAEHGGVSAFGADVIREMNRTGLMVDLSHAAETSFYDAIDISSLPVVCSHSSARALCDHPRNLTDEQMRRLAAAGGVAQVTLYHGFLRADQDEASVLDAVRHLNHMVDVMGIEHVGIGTDFDGDGKVVGCKDSSELINFTRQLLRHRYSEADLRLIWGENFLRVMRQVQQASTL